MGWEYRVFFQPRDPVDGSCAHAALRGGRPESRTDVYRPHTAEVGLKLRGGSMLELKQRDAVDEVGWENWSKTAGISEQAVLARVPPIAQPLPEVALSKRRVLAKLRVGGEKVKVEQTDVGVRVGGGGATSSEGAACRTVAIEGKRKLCEAMRVEILAVCRSMARDGEVHVEGYPSFVHRLAQQSLSQQQQRVAPLHEALPLDSDDEYLPTD